MKTEEIVIAIIREQSQIIGETLAISVAQSSGVLHSSSSLDDIRITNPDSTYVLDSLVGSYEKLFGKASVEVCQNVIKRYIKVD
ncbi:hypothetical protein GYA27_03995 [candidate division WWE3 bacterium]|uniref:Uncharacterized protein n=1 Tax=candidate division WWE3 bacterium TaxID=2053526 RepID=A0A7X9DKX0_UNCKA|nr:hypothetical protein [candidate division WWE3 bacterium]